MSENTLIDILREYIIKKRSENSDNTTVEEVLNWFIDFYLDEKINNCAIVNISEEGEEPEMERLYLENRNLINLTSNSIEIVGFGDWQPPTYVKIEFTQPFNLNCVKFYEIPQNKWNDYNEISEKVTCDILNLEMI